MYLKIMMILNYITFTFTFNLKLRGGTVEPNSTNLKAVYNAGEVGLDGDLGQSANSKSN